jgi:hypothetical protein
MPLLYSDSLQGDEDICNIFAAMRIGDPPPLPAAPPTPSLLPTPTPSSAVTHCSWPVASNNQDNDSSCISSVEDPQQRERTTPPFGGSRLVVQVPSAISLSPASGPRQRVRYQSPSVNVDLPGKYFCFPSPDLVLILVVIVHDPPPPVVRDVYNVASGRWTGIRETWYRFKPPSLHTNQLVPTSGQMLETPLKVCQVAT